MRKAAFHCGRLFLYICIMSSALITQTSWWKSYLDHLDYFEGKTSKDPNDSAAKCAPFAGAYHTNKGITFCTFKGLATLANIKPVTYDRFLKLSENDVSAILYAGFYEYLNLKFFKPSIALSLMEIAWGSGPSQAAKTLQKALLSLGVKVPVSSRITMEMINGCKKVGIVSLFSAIWKVRLDYLKSLNVWQYYSEGWTKRIETFKNRFFPR